MAEKEEAPAAAAHEGDAHPKKKKSKMLFLGLGGVLAGAAGLGVYMLVLKPSSAEAQAKKEEHPPEAAPEPKKDVIKLHVISMSRPVIVNLRTSHGTRYLKVNLAMEVNSAEVDKELVPEPSPPILDFLIEKFSNVDIPDVDNSPGRTRLKREIKDGINELLDLEKKGSITNVYFTEFVIQ